MALLLLLLTESMHVPRYLQLEKSWNFWPGTVMMWFTAPADASTAGPSFVLLGTKTLSFFGGNSHG